MVKKAPIKVLTKTLILILITAASCDGPVKPKDDKWVMIANFPISTTNVNGLSMYSDLYAIAWRRDTRGAAILRFNAREFEVVYESPEHYEYAELADITFGGKGGEGWAVGWKYDKRGWGLLALKFDRRKAEWVEVNIDGYAGRCLSRVEPIAADECWFLLDDNYYSGDKDGILAKYRNGSLEVFKNFGKVTVVPGPVFNAGPILYAVEFAGYEGHGEYGYSPGRGARVYLTTDGGASWVFENIPDGVVPGRSLRAATAAAFDGRHFYATVEFWDGARGILKRNGPPGKAEYDLVFLSYAGPYFQGINALAFKDPNSAPFGISADGLAVGKETSILLDEGKVYLEELPYPLDLSCVERAGGNGFFAVGKNLALNDSELLFHP